MHDGVVHHHRVTRGDGNRDEVRLDHVTVVQPRLGQVGSGELTAETVGTTRLALEDYEVSLFDVTAG